MDGETAEGVFQKVRRFVGLNSGNRNAPAGADLNLPWYLARCDSSWSIFVRLFKPRISVRDHAQRAGYYASLITLLDTVLNALRQIQTELRHSGHAKVSPDPSIPVLLSIQKCFRMLQETASLAATLAGNMHSVETFSGADAMAKMRQIEDSTTDIEVEYLHTLAEMVESVSASMQRNAEQRRRSLSKQELTRYEHAFAELNKETP